MAYVAITDQLVNSVQNKISLLANAEMATAADPSTVKQDIKSDLAVRARLLDKVWEPEADLRDRLSKYDKEADLKLSASKAYTNDEDGSIVTHTVDIEIGKANVPCFARLSGSSYYPHVSVRVDESFDMRLVTIFDMIAVRKEIEGRWDAVSEQVTSFLKSCKSLNEAVKLWPDVTRYISKEYLDRLAHNAPKKVKEESAAMAALRSMDFDKINASTVLARMSGAKV